MRIVIFGSGSDMTNGILTSFPPGTDAVLFNRKQCDVRYKWDVRRALAGAGSTDLVVNLAGVSHVQRFYRFDAEAAREEIETNLVGSFNIAAAACDMMPGAVQVYIASVAGLYGKGDHAGYCASKAGVISLVQSLGMEGYRAYAISPGRVNTKMREHDYPGEDSRTRLAVTEIGVLVRRVYGGEFEPGDNIIIRRIGHETQPIVVEPTAALRRETFKVGTNPAR